MKQIITIDEIKKLRELTHVGISDAKKALEDSEGDFEKAKEWLRKKGLAKSIEKSDKDAHEGLIGSYIHQNGKIGVIVEINCQTDFVARTDLFKTFAHDIAMHIAAFNPLYVSIDSIEKNTLEKIRSEFRETVQDKPLEMQEKIIDGKIEKYAAEICLLNQKFLKNDSITVNEALGEMVGKLGENIKIGRFSRIHIA